MATEKSLDAQLDERLQLRGGAAKGHPPDTNDSQQDGPVASAAIPPGMQRMKQYSVDELLKEMNRVPLFMTSLDETDGESGENMELEALKALAYEGTRAEIAQNFREQGSELVRTEKRYKEARDFYTKALQALEAPPQPPDPEQGPKVVEIDEDMEAKRERALEEACLVNRALCNLEMKNYGSCNRDCASVLRLNPRNIKAWYRAASACLALDKVAEALDACQNGLRYDSHNLALKALMIETENRRDQLAELEKLSKERDEQKRVQQAILRLALMNRKIVTRTTDMPPEMPEAAIALENPMDASSALSFPALMLYPVHAQTDFIKQFWESESLSDHLSYIIPLPWDAEHEYTSENIECYMEITEGGLIKAGKRLSLLKLLSSGKLDIVDRLLRVNVVPKNKAAQWIEEFKVRRGQ